MCPFSPSLKANLRRPSVWGPILQGGLPGLAIENMVSHQLHFQITWLPCAAWRGEKKEAYIRPGLAAVSICDPRTTMSASRSVVAFLSIWLSLSSLRVGCLDASVTKCCMYLCFSFDSNFQFIFCVLWRIGWKGEKWRLIGKFQRGEKSSRGRPWCHMIALFSYLTTMTRVGREVQSWGQEEFYA